MEPGKSGLVKSMVSMNAGLEDPRNSQKTAFQHILLYRHTVPQDVTCHIFQKRLKRSHRK